jgi:hypothetical protein
VHHITDAEEAGEDVVATGETEAEAAASSLHLLFILCSSSSSSLYPLCTLHALFVLSSALSHF